MTPMTASSRRTALLRRAALACLVTAALLAGCGEGGARPPTDATTPVTEAGATVGDDLLGAPAVTGRDADGACRSPAPLAEGAPEGLQTVHSTVAALAESAGAVHSLVTGGDAPPTWGGDAGKALILRRMLEALYRAADAAGDYLAGAGGEFTGDGWVFPADPAPEAALGDAWEALLVLQAGDLPVLLTAPSSGAGPAAASALCAVVDLFSAGVDALGPVPEP